MSRPDADTATQAPPAAPRVILEDDAPQPSRPAPRLDFGWEQAVAPVHPPRLPSRWSGLGRAAAGLATLLAAVAGTGANIVDVSHVREGLGLHVRETAVELVLETRGREHAQQHQALPHRAPAHRDAVDRIAAAAPGPPAVDGDQQDHDLAHRETPELRRGVHREQQHRRGHLHRPGRQGPALRQEDDGEGAQLPHQLGPGDLLAQHGDPVAEHPFGDFAHNLLLPAGPGTGGERERGGHRCRAATGRGRVPVRRLPSGLSPSVPEFHRIGRAARPGGRVTPVRGLSPPVRNRTEPRSARLLVVLSTSSVVAVVPSPIRASDHRGRALDQVIEHPCGAG